MRVLPFKIPKPANTAILFQIDEGTLYSHLHQHEEVQISFIKEGYGTLVVGDTVHSYDTGDVIIIGGGLPHVFKNTTAQAVMHTVFFSAEAFGSRFLALDEGKGIGDFYAFAKAGFKTKTTPDITALIDLISTAQGMNRLAYFIELIKVLSVSKRKPLSHFLYERTISEKDGKRMSAIFDFTLSHYNEDVSLDELAAIAAMTPNAFCKYFKKRTNKTYFQFLTEIRIEKAAALLQANNDLPIAEVAERCGYKTLSHFNKNFKLHKKITPSLYRRNTPV